jgi:hypothetical protein
MIPIGYMAKRVCRKPEWLQAAQVVDIYSVSNCISEDFADWINYWKHNGYWFHDSPEVIRGIAQENSIELEGTSLFYYEAYEMEFHGEAWHVYLPEPSFPTDVLHPTKKQLEGFDVVSFTARTSPGCSPLSCNSLAGELPANSHCLFASFEEAKTAVPEGAFNEAEPGPY